MTSKLKSSLMLFIFKCSPLDRRHLVRRASQGRPRCSALLGSITRRQPFGADTKAVGLTRDLLWNLSQSCTTRRKHECTQLLVYTHPDLSRCLSPTSASATTLENKRLFAWEKKKESPLKIRFFFVLDECQQKFNPWKGSVQQMPTQRLPVCVWSRRMEFRSKRICLSKQKYSNVFQK